MESRVLPKHFDAAVLVRTAEPLKFYRVEFPDLKFGQVLVKINYSGVCRSQLMEIDGNRGEDKWLPHMLGHEGSGEIIAVGDGVKKVKIGEEVILTWIKGEGVEADRPQSYSSNGIKINAGHVTTFSNYSVVSENRVAKKPLKKFFVNVCHC